MRVKMQVNLLGVGNDGDVVDVKATDAQRCCHAQYAVRVDDPAPTKGKASK